MSRNIMVDLINFDLRCIMKENLSEHKNFCDPEGERDDLLRLMKVRVDGES